jgi:mannitol/fructose-specific phosphotransferase system IIA component (Ntr-type)
MIKFLGIKKLGDDFHHSEDEIKIILSRTEEIGKITLQRLMMFEHIFDFGKTIVKEIMTPIDKVVFLDINSSYHDFLDTLKNSKFSRYPIKNGDRFEGFIHIKDVFLNSLDQNNFDLKKIIREVKIINENMLAEKALSFFQENNIQFALVSDIKGEIKGILTIEDIVEEICGEIRDEFEKRPVYRLDTILDEHSSVMDLKSVDRFSAISELIDKIFENKVLINPISINEIREKVIKREKSFSTAIGHQFAIPHARIEGLKKPIIVIGRSEKGIHFNSPDLKPVKFIFLILTPYADSSIQLNILAKISKLISNVTLRNKLLKAKTIDKVKEILTIFEDSIPLD